LHENTDVGLDAVRAMPSVERGAIPAQGCFARPESLALNTTPSCVERKAIAGIMSAVKIKIEKPATRNHQHSHLRRESFRYDELGERAAPGSPSSVSAGSPAAVN
jgi:hypothetical protein